MIPWHLSTWSTNDALRAVGLRHADGCIKRGATPVFGDPVGADSHLRINVFDTNDWLVSQGYVQRWPVVAEVA